jgi:hypothetical protein
MAELIFLLNSPAGRVWTGLHKSLPHVFLHLTIALQHMLSPFVALGHCLEYRQAVLAGQPLAVSAYKEASRFAMLQVQKINNIIHNGDLGDYRDPPSVMHLFYPESSDSTARRGSQMSGDRDRSSAAGKGDTLTPPRGDHRVGGLPDRRAVDPLQFEKRRLQGVMKHSKRGKVPVPVNLFPHTITKKMSYLCANASTLGLACLRDAKTCNFVHVLKLSDLPTEHRTVLQNFIENHADLTLAKSG